MKHIPLVYFLFLIAMITSPLRAGQYQLLIEIISLTSATMGMVIVWKGYFWKKIELTPSMHSHLNRLRTLIVIFLAGAVLSSFQWLTYFDRYQSPIPFNAFFQVIHMLLWIWACCVLGLGIFTFIKDAHKNKPKSKRLKAEKPKKNIPLRPNEDSPTSNDE